jgi:hypothetical protein
MSSGPTPPDANQVNQQQSQSNIATATAQQNLGQVDQVTPLGNQKYTQIGTNPDGTPKYQSTITLSPEQQGLYNTSVGNQQQIGNIAQQQVGQVGGLLAQPYKDYSQDRQKVEDALMGRLNTQFDKDRGSLEQSLANKGIKQGSAAATNAYGDFNRSVAEGRTSAILGAGQEQSRLSQLDMAQRGQGLNEVQALMGGSQMQMPSFGQTQGAGVAPVDVSGNAYNSYNAQKEQSNGFWNGVGAVGSTLGGWAFSDERLKTDKEKIGETPGGVGVYNYRMKGSPMMQMGVMAQELKKKQPEAVAKTPSGFLAVDYRRVK